MEIYDILEGVVQHAVVDVPVDVVVQPEFLCFEVCPQNVALDGTLGAYVGEQGFLGDIEGILGDRHVVDDAVEGIEGVCHLVVLGGYEVGVYAVAVFLGRQAVVGAGRVCQSAGLAHLLEDYAVHAASEIGVVHGGCRYFGGVIGLAVVGEGEEIDLVGLVGSEEYSVLFGQLFPVLLCRVEGNQLLRYLVKGVDGADSFFSCQRAVVEDLVLIVEQVVDSVEEGLVRQIPQFPFGKVGAEWIVLAVSCFWICAACFAIAPLFIRGKNRFKLLGYISALGFLLACAGTIYWSEMRNTAISISQDAVLRLSPAANAPATAPFPEGRSAIVRREHGDYLLLQSPDKKWGWADKKDVRTLWGD